MAVEWVYSDLETRVFNLVKKRIISEFKSKDLIISGGIFIKPKPKKSRLDLIELNGHHNLRGKANANRITNDFLMTLNINYQDDNKERVEEYTEFLYLALIDSLLSKNLVFRRFNQYMEYQTYRCSPYLWLGNCPFFITHISRKPVV